MTRYRWFVAALLFLVGMLTYLDRTALSVVAPMVRHEFGFGEAQMGLLFSAFFIGYCVFCFIGGWAADRFGPRKVFAWAVGIWSLFCGATAVASSFSQLLVLRIIFGTGEGPMGTTTNKAIANWFPQSESGRAVGLTNAGQPLGAAVAAPIVGLIALRYGWRISFVVIALIGFVWLALWLAFFRDRPSGHPRVSPAEAQLIESGRPKAPLVEPDTHHQPRSIMKLIFSAPVQGVAASFFCFNYVLYFFLSWLPSYLTDYQHLDVRHMSLVSILPWLGAAGGFVLGGLLSDLLYRLSGSALFARKCIIVTGLSVAALCVMLTAHVHSLWPAVTLIAVASLFAFMTPQACWSLLQDIVPDSHLGIAGGFVHFVANIAGVFSPSITGLLIEYGGGYSSAFILTSTLAATGVFAVLLLVRRTAVQLLQATHH
ncbi:MFS transporter [Frateuria aurantia]